MRNTPAWMRDLWRNENVGDIEFVNLLLSHERCPRTARSIISDLVGAGGEVKEENVNSILAAVSNEYRGLSSW